MSRYFCPGRAELFGSRTDYQQGRAMAAALRTGLYAEAERNGKNEIRVLSDSFGELRVETDRLWPDENEAGTPAALVRGVCAMVADSAEELCGFDCRIGGELTAGQGMDAVVAFTVLMATVAADLAEEAFFSPEETAKTARRAINRWFGTPCGLLGPMACAMGGITYMDFLHSRVVRMDAGLGTMGLTLCLTDTGGRPSETMYACVQADMTAVAETFGQSSLGRVRPSDFEQAWSAHREDLAWQRARHFFDENRRASAAADALGLRDGERVMQLMNESAESSARLLRDSFDEQSAQRLEEGLALSRTLLAGRGGHRIQDGGFGGSILALMPAAFFGEYRDGMEARFGPDSCRELRISPRGAGRIEEKETE